MPDSSQPQKTAESRPGAAPTIALQMVDVTVGSMRFAERVVLEEVNWTVRVGEYWAVGGLQASGKSDLLATAAGLMRPLRGSYRVFTRELSAGYEHELLEARLRVGLVFDGGRLLQRLTMAENILLPLRYHSNAPESHLQERAAGLLELIGMTKHAGSYPNTLGLNWQQRVGLARALCLKPEVLLLDNPLTGLDPLHSAWWLNVMDQLNAGHPVMEGHPLTLVLTGDDLRPWRNHARQYAILKGKRFLPLEVLPGGPLPEQAWLDQMVDAESTPLSRKGDDKNEQS